MKDYSTLVDWLMEGDVSIQYQTQRDLLNRDRPDLQTRIETDGWGAAFLQKRRSDGHWGQKFYQPKWTSSHYTLLDLKNLCISPDQKDIRSSIKMIASEEKGCDGGINPSGTIHVSDLCINGMFLNYACYFKTEESLLHSVVDFILGQKMPDGGFNCRANRSGAKHSSMHTTICALEGIAEYRLNAYTYRLEELLEVEKTGREFLLIHHLFRSDRTGEIIRKEFLRMPYPTRWRYDILRALDYLQYSGFKWDERITEALSLLVQKRNPEGHWNLHAKYPGQTHFKMETAGKPSRWNTLRALRVLRYFNKLD